MELYHARGGPFPFRKPRDDVIHRTEKNHGEKSVHAEVRMSYRVMREVSDFLKGPDRFQRSLKTHCRVAHGTDNNKPKRRAVAEHPEVIDGRQVMIDGDGHDGDHHHDTGHNGDRDEPCRKRPADKMMNPVPVIKESEGPEPDEPQIVAVDWPGDNLWDKVICTCQADGCEPGGKRVMSVPPIHGGLYDALINPEICHDIEKGKPEERGHNIPKADVQMIHISLAESLSDGCSEHEEPGGNKSAGEGGEFKPFQSLAVSGKDRNGTGKNSNIPQNCGQVVQPAELQRGSTQPCSEPDNHSRSRQGGPSVHDGVEVCRPDPSKRPHGVPAQPVGEVEFQRGHDAEERSDQEPKNRGGEVQHRGSSGRIV